MKFKLLLLLFPLILTAQSERWTYIYNGPGNYYDLANSIIYGTDGNIYIGGYSTGSGTSYDITAISLTSSGNERWVYTYDFGINAMDFAYDIIRGTDGNIYIAGTSDSMWGWSDFAIVSLTSSGAERWVYRHHSVSNAYGANSVVFGSDGNIYAAGSPPAISLTSTGQERWVYPDTAAFGLNDIVYGSDGNLYAAGYIQGTNTDVAVVSFTTTGNRRWIYQYNGSGNYNDIAYSIIYGSDGNIYIVGKSSTGLTTNDFLVISLTAAGGERWVYTYNGPGNNDDGAWSIARGADGNIYASGYSMNPTSDFTVISLSSSGSERWIYRVPGYARSIVTNPIGGLYATGDLNYKLVCCL